MCLVLLVSWDSIRSAFVHEHGSLLLEEGQFSL